MKIKNIKYCIFISCLLLQFSLFAQKNKVNPNGYNVFYYPNGKISSEGYMKDNKPDGLWKNYYDTGILKSVGLRKMSLLDSIWIFCNEKGDTTDIIHYYADKKSGYHTHYEFQYTDSNKIKDLIYKELYVDDNKNGKSFYYEKNHLKKIIQYENNVPDGWAYEYSFDTLIIKLYEYRNGFMVYSEKINRFDKDTLKQGVWKYFYPDGKTQREENYLHGQLNGFYKEYDPQGKLIKMIKYVYGKPVEETTKEDSIFTEKKEFYQNGALKNIGYYKYDSIQVGPHKKYDIEGNVTLVKLYNNNGILEGEGLFDSKGKKTGNWREYFPNGQLMAEGNYRTGKRTGKWTFYYEEGKIQQIGYFYKGSYDKEWNWYLLTGKLFIRENYYHGKLDGLVFQLQDNGDTLFTGQYVDGEKNGYWKIFDGDVISKGKFSQGYRDGEWLEYNKDNNKLIFKGNYSQGALNGKIYYYYNNGNLKRIEQYRLGIPVGNWQYYDYDATGHIVMTENYRTGNLRKINGVRFRWPKPLKGRKNRE